MARTAQRRRWRGAHIREAGLAAGRHRTDPAARVGELVGLRHRRRHGHRRPAPAGATPPADDHASPASGAFQIHGEMVSIEGRFGRRADVELEPPGQFRTVTATSRVNIPPSGARVIETLPTVPTGQRCAAGGMSVQVVFESPAFARSLSRSP